jgi:outer membrane PBP1 activator LpoA protein
MKKLSYLPSKASLLLKQLFERLLCKEIVVIVFLASVLTACTKDVKLNQVDELTDKVIATCG